MLQDGDGVAVDKAAAAAAYALACEAWNHMACLNLGKMYEAGDGVIANPTCSPIAASRANQPQVSNPGASGATPSSAMRPCVGRMP